MDGQAELRRGPIRGVDRGVPVGMGVRLAQDDHDAIGRQRSQQFMIGPARRSGQHENPEVGVCGRAGVLARADHRQRQPLAQGAGHRVASDARPADHLHMQRP